MLVFQVSDFAEAFRSNKHRYEKGKQFVYHWSAHDSSCPPRARCHSPWKTTSSAPSMCGTARTQARLRSFGYFIEREMRKA